MQFPQNKLLIPRLFQKCHYFFLRAKNVLGYFKHLGYNQHRGCTGLHTISNCIMETEGDDLQILCCAFQFR